MNSAWQKSTRSGSNGGNCVEVRLYDGQVQTRDSKNPTGPVLVFAPDQWRA
jgi:hypothetical protein